MQLLKDRILSDGIVKEGNVLKVDKFLNHQMDVVLFNEIGKEFAKRFEGLGVNKILTIEASGIGIACIAAQHFGNCPVIFAKKTKSKNLDGEVFTTQVKSFTKGVTYDVMVSAKFIGKGDKVLIIDDFLANGCALLGLIDILQLHLQLLPVQVLSLQVQALLLKKAFRLAVKLFVIWELSLNLWRLLIQWIIIHLHSGRIAV